MESRYVSLTSPASAKVNVRRSMLMSARGVWRGTRTLNAKRRSGHELHQTMPILVWILRWATVALLLRLVYHRLRLVHLCVQESLAIVWCGRSVRLDASSLHAIGSLQGETIWTRNLIEGNTGMGKRQLFRRAPQSSQRRSPQPFVAFCWEAPSALLGHLSSSQS